MSSEIKAAEITVPALVYLRTPRGVFEAQIWHQAIADLEGFYRGKIAAWHRLTSESAGVPLYQLAQLYPPPALPAEPKIKLPSGDRP